VSAAAVGLVLLEFQFGVGTVSFNFSSLYWSIPFQYFFCLIYYYLSDSLCSLSFLYFHFSLSSSSFASSSFSSLSASSLTSAPASFYSACYHVVLLLLVLDLLFLRSPWSLYVRCVFIFTFFFVLVGLFLFPAVKFYLLNSAVFNRIAFLYVCRTGQSMNTDGLLNDMCLWRGRASRQNCHRCRHIWACLATAIGSVMAACRSYHRRRWATEQRVFFFGGQILRTSNLNVTHDLSCLCECFVTRVNIFVLD